MVTEKKRYRVLKKGVKMLKI